MICTVGPYKGIELGEGNAGSLENGFERSGPDDMLDADQQKREGCQNTGHCDRFQVGGLDYLFHVQSQE